MRSRTSVDLIFLISSRSLIYEKGEVVFSVFFSSERLSSDVLVFVMVLSVLFVEKVPKLSGEEKLVRSAHQFSVFHPTKTVSHPEPSEFITFHQTTLLFIEPQNSHTEAGATQIVSFFAL